MPSVDKTDWIAAKGAREDRPVDESSSAPTVAWTASRGHLSPVEIYLSIGGAQMPDWRTYGRKLNMLVLLSEN